MPLVRRGPEESFICSCPESQLVVSITGTGLRARLVTEGRKRERGSTHQLYGAEIANIMECFDESLFQIQFWRDLPVAKYKSYDAAAMWFGQTGSISDELYQQAEIVGKAYLNEELVPEYFQRLNGPEGENALDLAPRIADYATRGFVSLPHEVQTDSTAEFLRKSLREEDWFYSLREGEVFAA